MGGFKYEYTSVEDELSDKLAKELVDMLVLLHSKGAYRDNVYLTRITSRTNHALWKQDFMDFMKDHDAREVATVFGHYHTLVHTGRCDFVCKNPPEFFSHYDKWLRSHNRSIQPVPESEIESLLRRLRRSGVSFVDDDLIPAVSQSVHILRKFKEGVIETDRNMKKTLIFSELGDTFEFVYNFIRRQNGNLHVRALNSYYLSSILDRKLAASGYPLYERERLFKALKPITSK